jgi:hypothetical protein
MWSQQGGGGSVNDCTDVLDKAFEELAVELNMMQCAK